ncbi:DNA-formamidopyrimidine glycosylase family protein [Arthrobacter glacialis]|uniref:DNA-(apurinic or apyrimidinic site) lyase n=1 Tax=Arthrobacter glacialis TaxID=1664 RepID=A0A2S4A205_ARTGL|nr:DNA-formamidopyrimidine glycosylase family protein [Arthrobacter glacialis]POH75349.1 DNA glycosylase [Arthrobacter glacialis]
MPEGDTVWRQARDLRAVLEGQTLTATDFRVPAYATLNFSGQPVTSVQSRGKHLLMMVGGSANGARAVIHSHLSMEGHWDIYPVAPGGRAGRWRRPAFTARVVLQTELATAVGFSLGTLEVLTPAEAAAAVGHLGPDLLGPDWDAQEALRRLLANPDQAIGLALLDQRNLAGIGNIYRNDLCFLGGVHPAVAVAEVPDLPRMVALAKRLLEANKDRSLRSTTGGPARGDAAAWVYGLAGKPCKRCGSLIRHATLADPANPARAARDIYWCPRCQAPAVSSV